MGHGDSDVVGARGDQSQVPRSARAGVAIGKSPHESSYDIARFRAFRRSDMMKGQGVSSLQVGAGIWVRGTGVARSDQPACGRRKSARTGTFTPWPPFMRVKKNR